MERHMVTLKHWCFVVVLFFVYFLFPVSSQLTWCNTQVVELIDNSVNVVRLLFFLVPKASPIPRVRKKLVRKCKCWNDPGVLPPQNCCGAR